MGSGRPPTSSLDSLMLAYTDLSAPTKGSGFKGPPVKDIVREAPRAVYHHSSKARDWSSLAGDLEAAFSTTIKGGGGGVQAGGGAQAGGAVQAGGGVQTGGVQIGGVVQAGGGVQTGGGEQDEWGDFAGFSSPSLPSPHPSLPPSSSVGCRLASLAESPVHRFKPQPSLPSSKSQPSSLLDQDDEFGDFSLPSSTFPAPSLFSQQPKQPLQLSAPSSLLPAPASLLPGTPSLLPGTPSLLPGTPSLLPITLLGPALLQAPPSALTTAKVKPPPPKTLLPAPKSILPAPCLLLPAPSPLPSSPKPPRGSASDRYSALRDLLDISGEGGDQDRTRSPHNLSLEPQNTSHNTSSEALLSARSPQPPLLAVASPQASQSLLQPQSAGAAALEGWLDEGDDFGDFASFSPSLPPAPSSLPLLSSLPASLQSEDEWSLPQAGTAVLPPPSFIPLPPSLTSSLPYMSSSPPAPSFLSSSPPPLTTSFSPSLRVEEFSLPSDQLHLSDQELFGVRREEEGRSSSNPRSIQDIMAQPRKSREVKASKETPARDTSPVDGSPSSSQLDEWSCQPSSPVTQLASGGVQPSSSVIGHTEPLDEWSMGAPQSNDEWSMGAPQSNDEWSIGAPQGKDEWSIGAPQPSDEWSIGAPMARDAWSLDDSHENDKWSNKELNDTDESSIEAPNPSDDGRKEAPQAGNERSVEAPKVTNSGSKEGLDHNNDVAKVNPQGSDEWSLKAPQNTDEWSLEASQSRDEWSLPQPSSASPPQSEHMNGPVRKQPQTSGESDLEEQGPPSPGSGDEWSLPPVGRGRVMSSEEVGGEVPSVGGDKVVPVKVVQNGVNHSGEGEHSSPYREDSSGYREDSSGYREDSSPSREESSPYKEWGLVLDSILQLLESSRKTLHTVHTEQVMMEVASSAQGSSFLEHLVEVYRLALRLEAADRAGRLLDTTTAVTKSWRDLTLLLPQCEEIAVLLREEKSAPSEAEGALCGLCRGGTGGRAVVREGGAPYHPPCANYWVNCVQDRLPRL